MQTQTSNPIKICNVTDERQNMRKKKEKERWKERKKGWEFQLFTSINSTNGHDNVKSSPELSFFFWFCLLFLLLLCGFITFFCIHFLLLFFPLKSFLLWTLWTGDSLLVFYNFVNLCSNRFVNCNWRFFTWISTIIYVTPQTLIERNSQPKNYKILVLIIVRSSIHNNKLWENINVSEALGKPSMEYQLSFFSTNH